MITPRKHLGQNFLHDPNTARKIVEALEAPAGAHVVEIGPGAGALTGLLAERYPNLTAVEVDERAVEHLRVTFPEVEVRHQDVLDMNWAALAGEKARALYVIGNLPYYITSPILFSVLEAHASIRRAVLMMQREVAERLVAPPRTKAYGILSVQTQLFARPSLLFRVSRHVFYPKPDVTSAVVALDLYPDADPDLDETREVVRTAFNQRRKTLRNSLRSWAEPRSVEVPEPWAGRRAEELTPGDFKQLTREMIRQRNRRNL